MRRAAGASASAARCGFGLCDSPAEHQVVVENEDGSVAEFALACGLHVTPVVTWGSAAPIELTRVRTLVAIQ